MKHGFIPKSFSKVVGAVSPIEWDKFLSLKKLSLVGYPGSTPAETQPHTYDLFEEYPVHIPYDEFSVAG